MIISASYRTDIPAFYGEWFKNRLSAGYCKVINPYSNKLYRVGLTKGEVQAFVFWTKNIGPFFNVLDFLKKIHLPFMVQYSINNYPDVLEGRVIDLQQTIQYARRLTNQYGHRCAVWRYDPIVVTSEMTIDWHVDNFSRIARQLYGLVDEVIVSFMQFYKKTVRNISNNYDLKEVKFIDPDFEAKQHTIQKLSKIAKSFNMSLSLCTQPHLVSNESKNIKAAKCIDPERLTDIAGYEIKAKPNGNRIGCCCAESRDIGAYDSCPHGCVYCYAVNNPKLAVLRANKHNTNSEVLIP